MKAKVEFTFDGDEIATNEHIKCASYSDAWLALELIKDLPYKALDEKWCTCKLIHAIHVIMWSYTEELMYGDPGHWRCSCKELGEKNDQ